MNDGTVNALAVTQDYLGWTKFGSNSASACVKTTCFGTGSQFEIAPPNPAYTQDVAGLVASDDSFYIRTDRDNGNNTRSRFLFRSKPSAVSGPGVPPIDFGYGGNSQDPYIFGPNNGGVAYGDVGKQAPFRIGDLVSCVGGAVGCNGTGLNNVVQRVGVADVTRLFADVGSASQWYWQRGTNVYGFVPGTTLQPQVVASNVSKFFADRTSGTIAWITQMGEVVVRANAPDLSLGRAMFVDAADLIVAAGQVVWTNGATLNACGIAGCDRVTILVDLRGDGSAPVPTGSDASTFHVFRTLTADTQYVYAATETTPATLYRAPLPNCR
jgi:hypothetical protein